jgi:uncharacterized protein (TIGR02246 family)
MAVADLEHEVRVVRDRLDIMELFSRYCFALDTRNADGVADCFTQDGLFMSGITGATRGRDAIRDLTLEKKARTPDGRCHMFINPLIELDGDRAKFRAYMLTTWIQNDRCEVSHTGRYFGTVVREGGRWLFEERHTTSDGATPANWGLR